MANDFTREINLGKDEASGLEKVAWIIAEGFNYETKEASIYYKERLYNGEKLASTGTPVQIILKDKDAVIGTRPKKKGKAGETEEYEISPASSDYTDYCSTDDKGRDKIIDKVIKERTSK